MRSGRWQGKYRDATGEKRSAGTYPHELKALAMAIEAEEKASLPGWRDPRAAARKWGDWCDEWWPTRGVEASTLRNDLSARKKHLVYWDDVPLAEIDRFAIKKWIQVLRQPDEKGKVLADSSVARYVRVFSSSLSGAADAGIIFANPAFRLGISPPDQDDIRFFTRKEVRKLLKRLEGRPADRALCALLVGCGLRWGEGLGLSAARIDFKRKIIRVAEVRDRDSGEIKKYPKSRKRRTVPLPTWVAEAIKPFAKGQVAAGLDSIFGHVDPSNWYRDVWKKFGPGGRPHDLRHTYASWLLQDGVELAKVSKLLGHSSQRVTERYAHLGEVPGDEVFAAMRLR